MGTEEKLVHSTLRIVLLVTLIVLSELIVPFGVLLLPLLLVNFIVRYLCRYVNPKYGKVLSGMSSLAASDDMYEKPLFTVLLYYFVDDQIDIQEHRKMFLSKVINSKDKQGQLCYPELQMYITTLFGYSIWKKDENFSIDNHIRLCDKKEILPDGRKLDEHGLMSATNDILIKPFAQERSPWEILIFHGAETKSCDSKKQSLVVFRYHHALSDGYSITKLMANVTSGDYFISPLVERDHAGWKRFLEFLLFPFTGMFVIVAYLQNYIDNNIWSYKVNFGAKKIRDMTYFCSDTISIDKIKELKNKLGCSFNGVVLAAIAGGIRKHFVTHENHVPPHMHVGLSFPVPGHPAQTLTNHWTAAFIRLPIGISSSIKRLDEIQKQFKKVETMIISKMPFTGALYGGAFFKAWISFILKNLLKGSTCSMSIFPGPENLQFLTGEKITSGGFLLGPLANQGVSITVVSYNGGLRVFFGAEKSVLCPEDAKQVVSFISNEFDNFLSQKIA